ncbi:hypothetical protein SRHO_G00147680 [Serrasalmus rhombeus]
MNLQEEEENEGVYSHTMTSTGLFRWRRACAQRLVGISSVLKLVPHNMLVHILGLPCKRLTLNSLLVADPESNLVQAAFRAFWLMRHPEIATRADMNTRQNCFRN